MPDTPPKKRKASTGSKVLKRLIIYPIILIAIWWTAGMFLQRQMLFPRSYAVAPANLNKPAALREVWIDTPEGKVEAWFLPGEGVNRELPGPAVLFAHGNAEVIDNNLDLMRGYSQLGISVMACEYRGYGRSAGSPSQSAITEDFIRFFDALVAMPEVDRSRIFFNGRSLGGGAGRLRWRGIRPAAPR